MRISLQEELDQLEAALQEEGDLVLRALRGCLSALERHDAELADEVIAFDDEVDETYVAIEEGIQSLLARQTPVAIDLRTVLAVLHVNLHLERMADYCDVPLLGELAGHRGQVAGVDHDAPAALHERLGQLEAEAAGGAGDDRRGSHRRRG